MRTSSPRPQAISLPKGQRRIRLPQAWDLSLRDHVRSKLELSSEILRRLPRFSLRSFNTARAGEAYGRLLSGANDQNIMVLELRSPELPIPDWCDSTRVSVDGRVVRVNYLQIRWRWTRRRAKNKMWQSLECPGQRLQRNS